jgi:hypothetical protein
MPRQLPWKVNKTAKQTPTGPNSRISSPSSSTLPTPTKSESTPAPEAKKPRRSLLSTPARSPSSSPPPEPLQEEFVLSSKLLKLTLFTNQPTGSCTPAPKTTMPTAWSRTSSWQLPATSPATCTPPSITASISRPVTGEMTDMVRRRQKALDHAKKQRKGVKKALNGGASEDDDDDEDESRGPHTSLRGLMDSPRRQRAAVPLPPGLIRMTSGRRREGSPSRSRPAPSADDGRNGAKVAGVKRELSSEDDDDDDDDDLDGRQPWPKLDLQKKQGAPLSEQPSSEAPWPSRRSFTDPTLGSHSNNVKTESPLRLNDIPPRPDNSHHNQQQQQDDDEDGDLFAQLKARRAEQRRRRQSAQSHATTIKTESREADLNSIPFI